MLRPTVGVLAAFRPEAWSGVLVLLLWLLMAVLYPFFAASNAMLVLAVGSLGYLVGSRVGQLGVWSGGILVPRYSESLFALCVFGVVLPALLSGLVCLWLGNRVPAVVPALLVGAATTRHAIRRGLDPSVVAFLWLVVSLAAGNSAEVRSQLVQAASVLSNVWIQLSCAAGAGLIAPGLYRELVRPTARAEAIVLSPGGLGEFSLRDLRKGTSIAAVQLGVIVIFWCFVPKTAGQTFMIIWLARIAHQEMERDLDLSDNVS